MGLSMLLNCEVQLFQQVFFSITIVNVYMIERMQIYSYIAYKLILTLIIIQMIFIAVCETVLLRYSEEL